VLADLPAAGVARYGAIAERGQTKRRPRLAVPLASTATIALLVTLLAALLLMAMAASQVHVSRQLPMIGHSAGRGVRVPTPIGVVPSVRRR